jgi:hypothetical protein
MFSEVSILLFKCLVQFACLQAQLAISLLKSIIVWSLLRAALWSWFFGNMLQWLRSHQYTVFSYSVQPLCYNDFYGLLAMDIRYSLPWFRFYKINPCHGHTILFHICLTNWTKFRGTYISIMQQASVWQNNT